MNAATPSHHPERGGLLVRLLLIIGVLLVLGAILWVVLLPGILASIIHTKTGFTVQVDRLAVNPLTANATIKGLVLKNPAGWPVEDFIELREFRAEASLFSCFGNRFVADEVVVDIARVTLVRNQQGTLNAQAFKEGFAGKEAAPAGPAPAGPKQEFLLKHLVLKFDQLVFADHSGRKPVVKEYDLRLNREMRDVDSVQKLISPFQGAALGLVTESVGNLLKNNPNLLNTLQDATKKTGEKLKGLLDSLDKKKP